MNNFITHYRSRYLPSMGGPRKRWVIVSHLCISTSSSCLFPPPSRRYGVVPFLHLLVVLGCTLPPPPRRVGLLHPPRRCGVGLGRTPLPRRVVLCCIPHRHVGSRRRCRGRVGSHSSSRWVVGVVVGMEILLFPPCRSFGLIHRSSSPAADGFDSLSLVSIGRRWFDWPSLVSIVRRLVLVCCRWFRFAAVSLDSPSVSSSSRSSVSFSSRLSSSCSFRPSSLVSLLLRLAPSSSLTSPFIVVDSGVVSSWVEASVRE
jgi:hypothetical protein